MPFKYSTHVMYEAPGRNPSDTRSRFVLRIRSKLPLALERLPSAERAIAEGVLSGLSNRELALERRTSTKTVANQLARLYERFDVHGRYALVRALEAE